MIDLNSEEAMRTVYKLDNEYLAIKMYNPVYDKCSLWTWIGSFNNIGNIDSFDSKLKSKHYNINAYKIFKTKKDMFNYYIRNIINKFENKIEWDWVREEKSQQENEQIQKPERITFEKSKQMLKKLGVKKVVFNKPVVVVQLNDGRKGVAKCGKQDHYDEEVGFALVYTQAVSANGVVNKSNFKRYIDNLSFRNSKRKKIGAIIVEV